MSIAACPTNQGTPPTSDSVAPFKAAMRRQTSNVAILATADDDGPYGMVANSVIAVSMDPASVLISVNQSASMYRPLCKTRRFSVNVLVNGHEPLIPVFSGAVSGHARFDYGDWTYPHGLPVLRGTLASLICQVDQNCLYGTHHLFIGRIESIVLGTASRGLLWHDGKAHASDGSTLVS